MLSPPDSYPAAHADGCAEGAEALTLSLLADSHDDLAIAKVRAAVDERVDVWTPALHTTSRFELVAALESIDDAITDVAVTFTETSHSGTTSVLIWHATGRFTRPAFFDDDQLVEPSGAVIRVAGATTVSFNDDQRADRIRCYYDRLGVVEQMLTTQSDGERR